MPGIEKATEGRYKVQLFTSGELGGNAEMVQQVRNGNHLRHADLVGLVNELRSRTGRNGPAVSFS